MKRSLILALLLAGCSARPKEIVCPSVVAWDKTFMQGVGAELVAHPVSDMPYFHELAEKALRQHRINESCK